MPQHYRRFYSVMIRMSLLMFLVGGISGLVFQELTKSLSYEILEPGMRLEALYHLSLLHGHAFLIGGVLPLSWVAVLQLGLTMGGKPISATATKWITATFVPGTIGVLSLIGYKGTHFVTLVKAGERDFATIDGLMFGGNSMLRGLSYGVIHTTLTVSIVLFAWHMWRCLGSQTSQEMGQS